jgi:hypothetical protein
VGVNGQKSPILAIWNFLAGDGFPFGIFSPVVKMQFGFPIVGFFHEK